jgi:hypothetical protein
LIEIHNYCRLFKAYFDYALKVEELLKENSLSDESLFFVQHITNPSKVAYVLPKLSNGEALDLANKKIDAMILKAGKEEAGQEVGISRFLQCVTSSHIFELLHSVSFFQCNKCSCATPSVFVAQASRATRQHRSCGHLRPPFSVSLSKPFACSSQPPIRSQLLFPFAHLRTDPTKCRTRVKTT